MGNPLFLIFVVPLLVAGVLVAEWRRPERAVYAYGAQGLVLALYLAIAAAVGNERHLYGWAATILAAKGILLPYLAWRYARGAAAEGTRPAASIIGAALAGLTGFALGHSLPLGLEQAVPFGLGAGLGIVAIASWAVLTHRDTLKVALGICLLENGVHLLLATVAWTIPEIVSIGMVIDVILAIWLLFFVGRRAEEATGARTDAILNELKG